VCNNRHYCKRGELLRRTSLPPEGTQKSIAARGSYRAVRESQLNGSTNRHTSHALLQSLTERLGSFPGLLVADVRVAHGSANILMAEQFPQILSHVVEKDHRG
jgi:hypothetical protein